METDIEKWHRWFAGECNNRAWEIASRTGRTPEEDREMLLAGYAAAFHWSKTGEAMNGARADFLIGRVHALTGDGEAALRFARKSLEWCETNPCEDRDLAFAHAGVSHAAAVLGNAALHTKHHALAESLGKALENDEDRSVFLTEIRWMPEPEASCGKKPRWRVF